MALRSEKLIPASAQQSGIWYHALFNRTSYWNTVDVKMFTGKVNVLALKRSLEKIVERHSVLRTNFILRDEMIWQLVRAEFSIEDIFEVEEKGINGASTHIFNICKYFSRANTGISFICRSHNNSRDKL